MKLVCTQHPDAVSEDELLRLVVDEAKARGWMVTHFRPARNARGHWSTPLQGDAGFPDLVMARGGVVIFAELKREKAKASADQRAWIEALGQPWKGRLFMDDGRLILSSLEHAAMVWRPSDWPLIERALT